jgi:hypothetical protein
MKFIRTFAGGTATAFLTVDNEMKPSVRWRGKPTKSILPEYGQWMRDSLQIAVDASGKSVLYLAPGTDIEPIVIEPEPKAA